MSPLDNLTIDTSSPVLVTGATGYVAGVLVKKLLDLGVTVHGTVRDPSKTDRLQYLIDLAEKSPGSIKFFKGNLLEKGSFAEGMKGCSIVFHTASPFAINPEGDPQKILIEPAVEGTRNVLNQATETPSVKRVVLTSSCVAINTDASETFTAPNEALTEEVWNRTASLDYQPYYLSKTLAEQAAWIIAGSQTQWSMTAINPGLVMGPGVKYHATSESFVTLKQIGGGEMASGGGNFSLGIVDVRDVADAHIVAAFAPEKAKGRHVLCGNNTSFVEVANALRAKYPEYPIMPFAFPKTMVWLLAPYLGVPWITRTFVQNNVEIAVNYDNTKSKEKLGIEYKSLEETTQDMFQQLIDAGAVSPKNK